MRGLRSVLNLLSQQCQALPRRLRLGIVARLILSFAGVAILIIGANVVIQQGILVESTTRVVPLAAPVVQVRPVMQAPPPVAPPPPVEVPTGPDRATIHAAVETALGALTRFEQASQTRVRNEAAAIDTEYKQADANLTVSLKPLVGKPDGLLSGGPATRISADLKAYTAQGKVLTGVADSRRATETTRVALLESLNARVKNSLAGAWKIFGRVVARQSLIQLSAELDNLRQNSEALSADAPATEVQLAAIVEAEKRVQKTLAASETEFRRSQGDTWYQAMASDMAQLSSLRENSAQLAGELTDGIQEFYERGNKLRNALFTAESTSTVPTHPVAKTADPAVAVGPPAALAPAQLAPLVSVAPPQRAVVETRSVRNMPLDPASRRAVEWASGAAAMIMIIICIGIVLSIVAPVRRLIRAASQIAAGQDAAHVTSDGITELDSLATAFNTMSAELAVARAASRDYQADLEQKVQERTRRLQELSERDPLTGLPNRRYLFALLDTAIERARAGDYLVGVLFLDIDNFKYINDGMGHAFGDSVLVAMGKRLEELVCARGFAARLGGDEFTVIWERTDDIEEIRTLGQDIVTAFRSPLLVDGRELVVSVSAGACAYPTHAQAAAVLLEAADMALFRAKALGRSQLSMFTSDLLDVATAKFATEQGLRRAIERGEFELYFQPEVSAETLEIGLVEALIRWRGADGRMILPGQFLAVAEESGLGIEIGEWVLRSAISAAAQWHRGAWPEARVAINVSPRQLADGKFADHVQELLTEYQLPARCIEIELTESVLQTGPSTVEALKRLRANGIAVALDDFGTGYSSLASLEVLPLTRIKLDRTLIQGIDTSPRLAVIAEAIINMSRGLGLEITAEGVERPEQFAYLVRHRAMFIQGYLLATPVPQQELVPLLSVVRQRARELLITCQARPAFSAEPAKADRDAPEIAQLRA
jgi:diguanylate cyclase (GGDEF)-like protein